MKLMLNITGEYQALPVEMFKQTTSVIYSVHGPLKYLNDPFTYPFIYL